MSSSVENKLAELSGSIHALPVSAVYEALETCPEGLHNKQIPQLLTEYGSNTIKEVKRKPLIYKLLAQFTSMMAIMLWIGGVAAIIGGMPQLAIAIWAVVIINGVFSFWQEFRADKAAEALQRMIPAQARVLRDGGEQRIPAEDLVPGDVIMLSEGDRISADARLVLESELCTDQSTLTGESHPVRKTSEAVLRTDLARHEIPNIVFAGTNVASGTGKAVVFATGMHSEFGKIAGLTQQLKEDLSPLQVEIQRLTRIVSLIAIGIGVLFFVLALLVAKVTLVEGFIFMMGMAVAFIPEGLLPTVTMSLAMGVQRMAKRNALVKKLSSVETLGCTTVICTDKTGTLTQNEMTVRNLWVGGHNLAVTGAGYAPEGKIQEGAESLSISPQSDVHKLLLAASLCNNARLNAPTAEVDRWNILGDPTEAALIVAARKAGIDVGAELQAQPRMREIPFDSRRKRMTTLHMQGASLMAYVKGAPRETLDLCSYILWQGQRQPLDETRRKAILSANDEYARTGLRVLAVAARNLTDEVSQRQPLGYWNAENVESELTFIGLEAMMDPPRPEVANAVERCHHAGIRIIMITGDYGLTASSIAQRINIVSGSQARIITGVELEGMSDDALKQALKGEVIFARVAPEHKLRVVANLQELGHVVAVTGDGVNDAPALKKADIGVAMGITGTDVAKEAATMVLTDDNFASIVNAVEEGRAVYANIKKFCTYIFTSNTPEAYPFILYVLSGTRIPLAMTVMQVLSVDLGTDILPALALGVERPEPGLMERPPRNPKEHVISGALLVRAYLILGTVQGTLAMLAFFFHYWTHGYTGQILGLPDSGQVYTIATTMTLAATVATQIGNLFAQRTERISVFKYPLFNNRLLWLGIAAEIILLILLSYVPFLQTIFNTGPIPPENVPFLIALIPALLVTDEIRKFFVRKRDRRLARR
ncbi:MAG: cation-transporting P-type ATPase [Chloroflexi bacterium]|nr:cation-transporting P-type ATPase [Chloroflexota bacterium]